MSLYTKPSKKSKPKHKKPYKIPHPNTLRNDYEKALLINRQPLITIKAMFYHDHQHETPDERDRVWAIKETKLMRLNQERHKYIHENGCDIPYTQHRIFIQQPNDSSSAAYQVSMYIQRIIRNILTANGRFGHQYLNHADSPQKLTTQYTEFAHTVTAHIDNNLIKPYHYYMVKRRTDATEKSTIYTEPKHIFTPNHIIVTANTTLDNLAFVDMPKHENSNDTHCKLFYNAFPYAIHITESNNHVTIRITGNKSGELTISNNDDINVDKLKKFIFDTLLISDFI